MLEHSQEIYFLLSLFFFLITGIFSFIFVYIVSFFTYTISKKYFLSSRSLYTYQKIFGSSFISCQASGFDFVKSIFSQLPQTTQEN